MSQEQQPIQIHDSNQNQQENQRAGQNQKAPEEPEPVQAPQLKKSLEGISIFCGICKDYVAHSVTTTCEHTFCELCLQEYMLLIDECPLCYCRIRNQKISNNILLDNLVADYIQKFQKGDWQEYSQRLNRFKEYQKRRKEFGGQGKIVELEAGMEVDIRDADFVWCKGRIFRTVNKYHDKKVKYVIVKYDKSSKKEELPQSSTRLAPAGMFTSREDLPRYQRGKIILKSKDDEGQQKIYVIPKPETEKDSHH